jgi:putative glutamine amidotransferase
LKPVEGSFLEDLLEDGNGDPPLVLSSHHQAIEELGKGWKVAATSVDGVIIEAIEHGVYPHVLGVQFHPEKPGLYDPSIIHKRNRGGTISFHEQVRESGSSSFHHNYWEHISSILKKNRTR